MMYNEHSRALAEENTKKKKALFHTLEKLVGKITNGVITVSTFDYIQALRHNVIAADKIKRIHNGIPDDERCFHKRSENNSLVRLLMVARFAEPKDHRLLFQALSRLRSVNWHLKLVGGRPCFAYYKDLCR